MPNQSLFRFIKRWKRYEPRENWRQIPRKTRGVYVLYDDDSGGDYKVTYVGVAGLGKAGGGGVRGRLEGHNAGTKKWTHFSVFEVHDNITREEIRELEALLLEIFRHDSRIQLANKQKGSKKLYQLRRKSLWANK